MATKISKKQLSQEVLDLINSGGGGALLKQIISNVAVGAAPAGSKFPEGQTLTQFAEQILRKDITPTISTSFSGSGIKEIGTIVNGTTMTLTISNLSSVTVPINKIDFYMGNTLVDSQTYQVGKATYNFVYNNQITSDITAKAILTYNGTTTASGNGSFVFVYSSFFGTTALNTIDTTTIEGYIPTFKKIIKNAKAHTESNIILNDEKFCYFYPTSFGELTSIKDGNGFEQINSYTKSTVNITYPTNNQVVQYYVYLLTDSTTGQGFKQIYS